MLCARCIPRCGERFVCITIIAFPPHPLLCQTNDFLPFCVQVCTGRRAPRKHRQRKSRSVSLTSAFAGQLTRFARVRSNLHNGGCALALWGSVLGWSSPVPPPSRSCEWYSPFKKGACHLSVLCVLSTVSCREHISQGQCWLFNTRTHIHTHPHSHMHTHRHCHAPLQNSQTHKRALHTRSALLADTRFPRRMSPLKEEDRVL